MLCLDTLLTGREDNLAIPSDFRFAFERTNVTRFITVDVAGEARASTSTFPSHAQGGSGRRVEHARLGEGLGAKIMLASTSKASGDPNGESAARVLLGNVTPVVPPAGATTMQALLRGHDDCVPPRTRRPSIDRAHPQHVRSRMCRDHARAFPTLVSQTLRGRADHGSRLREPEALAVPRRRSWRKTAVVRVVRGRLNRAVNISTPEEVIVPELAERIRVAVGSVIPIEFTQRPEDDPQLGRTDLSLAGIELGWEPKVPLETGLEWRVAWASETWTT
jgi:hypothetical protein